MEKRQKISVTELVRELRRRSQRLKHGFGERRRLVNIAPINDRRRSNLYSSRPAPTTYEWIISAESGPLEGMRYAVASPVVVGQGSKCDLTLMSSQVSLQHMRLTLERYGLKLSQPGLFVSADEFLSSKLLDDWSHSELVQYILDHEVPVDPHDMLDGMQKAA